MFSNVSVHSKDSKSFSKSRVCVSSHLEWFYSTLASIGVCRVYIRRTQEGELKKEHVKSWRLLLFVMVRLNVAIKAIFLFNLLLSPQPNGDYLDFLSVIGIVIYFVVILVAVYSDYYFSQIFPAFELFCAFWNVQSDIYAKLSEEYRNEYKEELNRSSKIRTTFHTCAAINAMIGTAVQYFMDPKGLAFTGSLTDSESPILLSIFFVHEQVFLLSGWYQAVAIILVPVLVSRELTVSLHFLTKQLSQLRRQQQSSIPVFLHENIAKRKGVAETTSSHQPEKSNVKMNLPADNGRERGFNENSKNDDKSVKPDESDSRRQYNINLILDEYARLQIVSDQLDRVSSFILLITQLVYTFCCTTDVFVAIQLIKIGDWVSVGYYAADCTAGMVYWFFSLWSMGKLDTALEQFKLSFLYYYVENPRRRLHLKKIKSFREIQVKLGTTKVRKGTCSEVVFELFNYYICAAMW